MIRRIYTSDANDDFQKLCAALRTALTALAEPNVETRVREYFVDNPNYSRDAVHVAAIACHFAIESQSPDAPTLASTGTPALLPKP
jgi:hypothetical protein